MDTTKLTYRILGPLEVRRDGMEIPIPANQQRVILACLLAAAGRLVRFETLIQRLWSAAPPDGARNAVQTYVGRLRRLLPSGTILSSPGGYSIEPRGLDLARFQALTRRAQAEDSQPEAAVGLWRQAMSLWTGPVLGNVASASLHAAEGAWLTEELLAAAEQRFELELRLGQYATIAPELTALTAAHPLSERLRGQLMRALQRSGRQADALTVYRATARMLRAETGLEPSTELQALHQEILLSGSRRPENAARTVRDKT